MRISVLRTKFVHIYFKYYIHNQYVRFVLSAKFHKNRAHFNFETKPVQVFKFRSRSTISNIIFMINKLDLLSLPDFIVLEYISFLGPNFPGMKGLILVLMSNICYLAVILIFLVVTWWLLLVIWWLLVVTTCYRWLLLVPTFSVNAQGKSLSERHCDN